MGIYSLPTPSEGVLTILLVNTVLTISTLKQIFRSVLHVFGLAPALVVEETTEITYVSFPPAPAAEPSLTERFRSRVKPVRFETAFGLRRPTERHADCCVCLAWFEPESLVNRLHCGHLFHKSCVERWLDYRNATCPLCRSHLLPDEDLAGGGGSLIPVLW